MKKLLSILLTIKYILNFDLSNVGSLLSKSSNGGNFGKVNKMVSFLNKSKGNNNMEKHLMNNFLGGENNNIGSNLITSFMGGNNSDKNNLMSLVSNFGKKNNDDDEENQLLSLVGNFGNNNDDNDESFEDGGNQDSIFGDDSDNDEDGNILSMFSNNRNESKKRNIFSNIRSIIKKKETPINRCNYKIKISKVIKNFPVKATCKPLRVEFENGYNSRNISVFSCQQKLRLGNLNIFVRLEIESFLELARNKDRIIDSLNDPGMVFYQISNNNQFMEDFNPKLSISCEKIKIAFGMFN